MFNNVSFSVDVCVNQGTEHLKACVNVNVCVCMCVCFFLTGGNWWTVAVKELR